MKRDEENKDEDMDEQQEDVSRKFVYTATTLRLME
jgi:hypothetical protein